MSIDRIEEIIAATRLNELINMKKEDEKISKTILWGLAIIGAIAAVAAIAYAVYRFVTPDFEDDFEDFEDDDFEEDIIDDEEDFFKEEDEVQ